MDDLYDNLENYEDVNVIDELKAENKNLKLKLEEYALNMDKLQKNILQEFDKLTSEYTKLEMNYSSLLKTARAEVERKSQIITNLNIEKDMMILNSMKNKNTLNIRRNVKQDDIKNSDADLSKNVQHATDALKSRDSNFVRLEEAKVPAENEVTALSTGNQIKNNKLNNDSSIDTKENNSQFNRHIDVDNQTKWRPCSIKNRRKSMPASRQSNKFTSDEEYGDSYSREEVNNKGFSIKNNQHSNSRDRTRDKKQSKLSDMSSVDDKYSSNYESSKDMYSKRWNSKQIDDDRYKSSDRHEHRRNYSPERSHRRSTRNCPEDRYRRSNYRKDRVSESPPRGRFQHYNRRSLDQKSKHDKDYPEKYRHQQHDRYSGKHKLPNDYEVLPNKRLKTDSYSRYNEETAQSVSGLQSDIHHPIAEVLRVNESCQSPDYVFADPTTVPPITEIRSTAAVQLEDPRITNNRYVMKTVNGKKELSTVTGRNVIIQPVDKVVWNIKRVDMPQALVQPPSPYSEEAIQDGHMDIDNQISNMSLESGEILCFDTKESDSTDFVTAKKNTYDKVQLEVEPKKDYIEKGPQTAKFDENVRGDQQKRRYKIPTNKNIYHEVELEVEPKQDYIEKRPQFENLRGDQQTQRHKIPTNKNTYHEVELEVEPKQDYVEKRPQFAKSGENLRGDQQTQRHKIPTNKNTYHEVELEVEPKQDHIEKRPQIAKSDENVRGDQQKQRYKIPKIKNNNAPLQNEISNRSVSKNYLHIQSEIQGYTNDDINKRNDVLKNDESQQVFKNKEMIEVDLELSDDDIGDFISSGPIDASSAEKITGDESIKSQEIETIIDNSKKITKTLELQNENGTGSSNSDSSLKIKIKKNPHRSHKISKEMPTKEENEQNSHNKTKPKKCDPVCKEIKTKFSDLFGESSSLITPEDLGLTSSQVQNEISTYVPIFEDAQDAVDLNLKDCEEEQILSTMPEIQNTETSALTKLKNDEKPKSVTENKKKPKKNLEDNADMKLHNIECSLVSKEQKTEDGSVTDTDVVKTVIISTGVQPQYASVINDVTTVEQQTSIQKENNESDVKEVQETPMKALATSTPERELQQRSTDINPKLPELSTNTNESRTTPRESQSLTLDQSSSSNILNTENNADAPDLRIFVKRRRRGTKRETPSKC
ncbi:uncharacterized protein ACR2FA_003023 [Aphomia sociella]